MTITPARPSAGPAAGSLLTEADLGRDRFLELVDLAAVLKLAPCAADVRHLELRDLVAEAWGTAASTFRK